MSYQELGFEILKLRRLKKLNQTQLAAAASVSRNYISLIERGLAENISVGILGNIAKVLDVETKFLVEILERES